MAREKQLPINLYEGTDDLSRRTTHAEGTERVANALPPQLLRPSSHATKKGNDGGILTKTEANRT